MGTSREGQRTVLWSRALVWTLCALTGCASSVPDHASQLPQKTVQSNGYRCFTDADVPPNDRQAVETAALAFVRAAVGANASDAYAMMTATTRSIGSADAFAAMIRAKREETGPYSDIGVAHTYLIENAGHGTEAICGLATSRKWIAVELKPERKQAYVVISARTLNNGLHLTVWLVPDGGGWAVESFHIGMESVAGRSADDLLALARKERDAGQGFNAAALYACVRSLINRGPNFQLAIAQDAARDLENLQVPPELTGAPPFVWNLGGGERTVESVTIIGVEGKLGLVFMLPLTTWTGKEAADRTNREFLIAFIAAHPDYSRVFGFLVARALKPDKSGGFATVYELGRGFI